MSIEQVLGPNSAFAQQVRALALDKLADYLQPLADDVVRRADENVEKLYNTDRSGDRSRGGDSLHGSFSATVQQSGDFPVKITLRSSLMQSNPAKLWSLENGSVEHVITGNPLVFPTDGSAVPSTLRPSLRVARKTQKQRGPKYQLPVGGKVRTPVVNHPGTRAGKFMQRAMDSAIQSRLRLSRGLTAGGRR